MRFALVAIAAVCLWAALGITRLRLEMALAPLDRKQFALRWDPRDAVALDKIARDRESESFRSRSRSGHATTLPWPGLKSAEISWTWLQVLVGLHNEASYEGDFSWIFGKLDFIMQNTPPEEIDYIKGLAPFFFVIGHDVVGANILAQTMIERGPQLYNTWFWTGLHALENKYDLKEAAYCYQKAAENPQAPSYLKFVAMRLSRGYRATDSEMDEIMRKEHPDLYDLWKASRNETRSQ